MRSIRSSLIVYFLVLLGAALGGVSWFAYHSTQQALAAKEKSTSDLLHAQYHENCVNVRVDFDRKLLNEGRELSKKLDTRCEWHRHHYEPLSVLGLLNVPWTIQGHVQAATWLRGTYKPLFPGQTVWTFRLVPPEEEMPFPLEGEFGHGNKEYFQVHNVFNGQPVHRSENLDDWLPLDEAFLRSVRDSLWKPNRQDVVVVDDVQIRPGTPARRARLVVQLGSVQEGLIPRWLRKGPKGLPTKERDRFRPWSALAILQYAKETTARNESLADLEKGFKGDLARLQEDNQSHLADLRKNMLWIGLGAFAALVAGGGWLVRLGLNPLNRLSQAVRRVSSKDLRLQVTPQELPRELRPIAVCLTETLDQLRAAFAREKQTAADISHELRTPLATLLTNLDIGLNKPRTPEQYREILEECRQSGRHMNQLVERLLTLARLDASAIRIRARPVDVGRLAEQCADLVRPLAKARGLNLRVHTSGPAVLQADPDKLSEVLNNLFSNAVEYNRPNGAIDLTIGRDNGHLTVEVKDTGFGIGAEAREHIFERFFRGDPSRHADIAHAGLGLAIVKEYVDLMGGTIGVQSSPAGSTFRVELPP